MKGTTLLNLEIKIMSLGLVFHDHVKLNNVHNLVYHTDETENVYCGLSRALYLIYQCSHSLLNGTFCVPW